MRDVLQSAVGMREVQEKEEEKVEGGWLEEVEREDELWRRICG
jgi:hypothetical protein